MSSFDLLWAVSGLLHLDDSLSFVINGNESIDDFQIIKLSNISSLRRSSWIGITFDSLLMRQFIPFSLHPRFLLYSLSTSVISESIHSNIAVLPPFTEMIHAFLFVFCSVFASNSFSVGFHNASYLFYSSLIAFTNPDMIILLILNPSKASLQTSSGSHTSIRRDGWSENVCLTSALILHTLHSGLEFIIPNKLICNSPTFFWYARNWMLLVCWPTKLQCRFSCC